MGKIVLNDLEMEIPNNWKDQGMITLTLPSTDKNVRPNIILTKEHLSTPIDLKTYFEKIKQSVQQRQIQSFEILDESELQVSGVPAMQMVCQWDLSSMKQMAERNSPSLQNIQPGQMVQQIQLSLIHNDEAINFTASFPAEQFAIYSRPFEKFVQGLRFV